MKPVPSLKRRPTLSKKTFAPDGPPAALVSERTCHPGKSRAKLLRCFCAALAIAATPPFAASAHHTRLSKPYAACMDKSGGVMMNMIGCVMAKH